MDLGDIGREWNEDGLLVLRPGEDEGQAPDWGDLTPAEQAAVEFFETHQEALFDIVCDALEEHVAREEEEDRRIAARREQERGVDRDGQDAILYGEKVDTTPAVDGGLRDLFDDPVEETDTWAAEDDDLDEAEPIHTRFEITTLVLVPGRRPDHTILGFRGHADWEPEHGLGVLVDDLEVQAIGYADLTL